MFEEKIEYTEMLRLIQPGEKSKSPFVYGHMTKMATTPIQGKNLLKSSLKSKGQWVWDMVCRVGNVVSTKFSQMMILG